MHAINVSEKAQSTIASISTPSSSPILGSSCNVTVFSPPTQTKNLASSVQSLKRQHSPDFPLAPGATMSTGGKTVVPIFSPPYADVRTQAPSVRKQVAAAEPVHGAIVVPRPKKIVKIFKPPFAATGRSGFKPPIKPLSKVRAKESKGAKVRGTGKTS